MAIIDHGKWVKYIPDVFPEGAPTFAMFARRESDGQDWYDYVNSGDNFSANNIKFMASWQDMHESYVVGPAVYDPTMLFPANQIVGEIDDYTGSDPQTDFGGKLYNPETQVFTDPPPPAPPETMETMIRRVVEDVLRGMKK